MLCCKNWRGYHFVFHVSITRGKQNLMTIQFFPRIQATKGAQQRILLEEQVGEICNRWWFRCPMTKDDSVCDKRVCQASPATVGFWGSRVEFAMTSAMSVHKKPTKQNELPSNLQGQKSDQRTLQMALEFDIWLLTFYSPRALFWQKTLLHCSQSKATDL